MVTIERYVWKKIVAKFGGNALSRGITVASRFLSTVSAPGATTSAGRSSTNSAGFIGQTNAREVLLFTHFNLLHAYGVVDTGC